MKKWAVGFISYFDNQMSIKIVNAPSWKDALNSHPATAGYGFDVCSDLETAKQFAYDQDTMIDVVEITL